MASRTTVASKVAERISTERSAAGSIPSNAFSEQAARLFGQSRPLGTQPVAQLRWPDFRVERASALEPQQRAVAQDCARSRRRPGRPPVHDSGGDLSRPRPPRTFSACAAPLAIAGLPRRSNPVVAVIARAVGDPSGATAPSNPATRRSSMIPCEAGGIPVAIVVQTRAGSESAALGTEAMAVGFVGSGRRSSDESGISRRCRSR